MGPQVLESDWKLFRKRLPGWQEKYMEKLIEQYITLLQGDGAASDHFWELEKRIWEDQKSPGVQVRMSRSRMHGNLLGLIRVGAITLDDLDGFSAELQETISYYYNVDD